MKSIPSIQRDIAEESRVNSIRDALLIPVVTDAHRDHARNAFGRWGAHRAYLMISGSTGFDWVRADSKARKADIRGVIRLLERAGAKVQKECHGCGGAGIYLGYDNFEGGKYAAKGLAMADALKEIGIDCHVEACGD